MAQAARRGLPAVQPVKVEGVQKAPEGGKHRFTPDVSHTQFREGNGPFAMENEGGSSFGLIRGGRQRFTSDVVTSRPDITMGDEGVPNPSQYLSGERTRV